MTRRRRDKERRESARARMTEMWERWVNAHTRTERRAQTELLALIESLLLARGKLSREELYDEHRTASGLKLKEAIAEVDSFHPKVAQRLRDKGMLIYPVTEVGYLATKPPLPHEVSYHVPGMGRGQAVHGWCIAKSPKDLVFEGYWNMRLNQSRGGYQKVEQAVAIAVGEGVMAKPLPHIKLPGHVDGSP